MIKVGIIGAGSLVAGELLNILLKHKKSEIAALHSETYKGKPVSSVLPFLKGRTNLLFEDIPFKSIRDKCDCVFVAKSHGEASGAVKELFSGNMKIIDISADFRLPTLDYYKKWYPQTVHKAPELLSKAVYGLPEIYREKIKKSNLTANPGCYPTAAILSLSPLVKKGVIKTDNIVINAFSGASGAGRVHKEGFNLFIDVYRNLKVYKPATHQHTPEMELVLGDVGKNNVNVTFIPCLIPVDRGILAMSSHFIDKKFTKKDIVKIYKDFYNNEPFIRIYEDGYPEISAVQGTNFCDIGFEIDIRNNLLLVMACIDNLVKGAAGQAVQNMNIMFEIDENEGLI